MDANCVRQYEPLCERQSWVDARGRTRGSSPSLIPRTRMRLMLINRSRRLIKDSNNGVLHAYQQLLPKTITRFNLSRSQIRRRSMMSTTSRNNIPLLNASVRFMPFWRTVERPRHWVLGEFESAKSEGGNYGVCQV
jgi:hypothetical protein